jgi:hypothetical protein
MAAVQNVGGQDLIVPELGDQVVKVGQIVEVPSDRLDGYLCQPRTWAEA